MRMAADKNVSLPYGGFFSQSLCNQHIVSFQSRALKSSTEIVPGGVNISGGLNGTTGMMLTGNSRRLNSISSMMSSSNTPANVLDSAHGLKLRAKFAVDWSNSELELLKQGLARYASEPNILKYIKISAMLPDKTVRDVAMRCRWMTKKETGRRRKPDDCFTGKKIKDRKDKLIGSTSVSNMQCSEPESTAMHSFSTNDVNQDIRFSCEATSVIDCATQQLLDDNVKLLHQIAVNLEYNKIQHNIDLLCRSRENITAILNSMSGTPGIMSRMPPLPVHIDENLIDSLLPFTNSPSAVHACQENQKSSRDGLASPS